VEDDFFMFGAYEVVDDVGARGVTTGVAEPLGTNEAFDNR
jgi:hypothetical protein